MRDLEKNIMIVAIAHILYLIIVTYAKQHASRIEKRLSQPRTKRDDVRLELLKHLQIHDNS